MKLGKNEKIKNEYSNLEHVILKNNISIITYKIWQNDSFWTRQRHMTLHVF